MYTRDEAKTLIEGMKHRRLTEAEGAGMDRGCGGLVSLLLGHDPAYNPSVDCSFRDPIAHAAQREAERMLCPGEQANVGIRILRDNVTTARRNVASAQEEYRRFLQGDPEARDTSVFIRREGEWAEGYQELLGEAKNNAKRIWEDVDEGSQKWLNQRVDAQIQGGFRTLDRVSGYADKINDILADHPSETEFYRRVAADNNLSQISGLKYPGENKKAAVIAKKFFSGRRLLAQDEDLNVLTPSRSNPD